MGLDQFSRVQSFEDMAKEEARNGAETTEPEVTESGDMSNVVVDEDIIGVSDKTTETAKTE